MNEELLAFFKIWFHFDSKENKFMTHRRWFTIAASGALILILFAARCSRKAAPAGPAAPEVLVTTATPKDVPRILERVATLDGFINANINAQV